MARRFSPTSICSAGVEAGSITHHAERRKPGFRLDAYPEMELALGAELLVRRLAGVNADLPARTLFLHARRASSRGARSFQEYSALLRARLAGPVRVLSNTNALI